MNKKEDMSSVVTWRMDFSEQPLIKLLDIKIIPEYFSQNFMINP